LKHAAYPWLKWFSRIALVGMVLLLAVLAVVVLFGQLAVQSLLIAVIV
jgi:hypothetical protein